MSDEGSEKRPQGYSRDAPELRQFACAFTKDWESRATSFVMLADSYIRQLPPERRAALGQELRELLFESTVESDEALLQVWYGLGAEAWDEGLTVRPMMLDFYWLIDPDAPEFEGTGPAPAGGHGFMIIGVKRRHREDKQ